MSEPKYTKALIEAAVRTSTTNVEVLQKLGAKTFIGGMNTYIRSRIRLYRIDTSHFVGSAHGRGITPGGPAHKKPWREVLTRHARTYRTAAHVLRRALLESGVLYKCRCGQGPVWKGRPLTLEIDHKNGDWQDDRKENLQIRSDLGTSRLGVWLR